VGGRGKGEDSGTRSHRGARIFYRSERFFAILSFCIPTVYIINQLEINKISKAFKIFLSIFSQKQISEGQLVCLAQLRNSARTGFNRLKGNPPLS
jgi:hypothetical protein